MIKSSEVNIIKMEWKHLLLLFIVVGVQIQLPVDMFPATSEDHRTDLTGKFGQNSDSFANTGENIKGSGQYNDHVDNSSANKQGYVPIIAAGTLDLNMKGSHNVKHVAEFNMRSGHSKPSEIPAGLLGSTSKHHNTLNGKVNQARPIDLHELKTQADGNGLESDLSTNQIKPLVSLPTRDLIDTKLEQVQKRLLNLSDNLPVRRNRFPIDNGPSRESIEQRILNDRQESANINILADTNVKLDKQSIKRPPLDQYVDNKTLNKTFNQGNVEGVVWSNELEKRCSKGYSTTDYFDWKVKVENYDVIKMEDGCGSMQNRLVTFNDSTQACVRYRINSDQMQGDIYSFYLSKLLNLDNTPPTAMLLVTKSQQWRQVWNEVLKAKWSENKPVIVTKWVQGMESVYMPDELKDHKSGIRPQNYGLGTQRPFTDLCNLMQWSDLVLFDYISANLDRVVNNMFNLKWNTKMLEKPVHNLERETTSGRLVFLDNESGLFHGYRLLETYGEYHEMLLKSVCVFRKSSVDAVLRLVKDGNIGERLQQFYEQSEKVHNFLPRMGKKNMSILQQRLQNVLNHINLCKKYSTETSVRQ